MMWRATAELVIEDRVAVTETEKPHTQLSDALLRGCLSRIQYSRCGFVLATTGSCPSARSHGRLGRDRVAHTRHCMEDRQGLPAGIAIPLLSGEPDAAHPRDWPSSNWPNEYAARFTLV